MTTTRNKLTELRLCSDHMLEHFADSEDEVIAVTVPQDMCPKCEELQWRASDDGRDFTEPYEP